MGPAKLLFGAAGFSIAATALFMDAGTASAEDVCTTFCQPDASGVSGALQKVDTIAWKYDGVGTVAMKLQYVTWKLETILITRDE